MVIFWDLLPHMPQEASRWPQDRSRWLSGGNLGPTWAQVGSKLPGDGLKLASSWLKLGPSWFRLGPKSAPGGSKRLSWRVLRGSREGLGAKRCSRRPQGCKNDPQEPPKWPKSDAKKLQIWGEALYALGRLLFIKKYEFLIYKGGLFDSSVFFVSNLISWPKLSGLGLPKLLWYKHFSLHRIQYCDGSCLDLRYPNLIQNLSKIWLPKASRGSYLT